MSKRDFPYLRRALFQAALATSFRYPVLKAFYQKKKSEDRHHLICIGTASRKLCHIIYTALNINTPMKLD